MEINMDGIRQEKPNVGSTFIKIKDFIGSVELYILYICTYIYIYIYIYIIEFL